MEEIKKELSKISLRTVMKLNINKSEFVVLWIHYSADPKKDPTTEHIVDLSVIFLRYIFCFPLCFQNASGILE